MADNVRQSHVIWGQREKGRGRNKCIPCIEFFSSSCLQLLECFSFGRTAVGRAIIVSHGVLAFGIPHVDTGRVLTAGGDVLFLICK